MITRDDFEARLTARAATVVDGYEAEYLSAHRDETRDWASWREGEIYRTQEVIRRWGRLVPPLCRDADLDLLEPAQNADEIRAFLTGSARNLLLSGPVGTGKSFAAWAVAHEAAANALSPRAWSMPRLLLDMRPDGDPEAFADASSAGLLVLDDLGAARPTDWAIEQVYSIAEERTNHHRRTVITTNSTYAELVNLWGGPTMDRFRDLGVAVTMKGASRRGSA